MALFGVNLANSASKTMEGLNSVTLTQFRNSSDTGSSDNSRLGLCNGRSGHVGRRLRDDSRGWRLCQGHRLTSCLASWLNNNGASGGARQRCCCRWLKTAKECFIHSITVSVLHFIFPVVRTWVKERECVCECMHVCVYVHAYVCHIVLYICTVLALCLCAYLCVCLCICICTSTVIT